MQKVDVTTKNYWTRRYNEDKTGWDIGCPSTPLKTYIEQLENKTLKILIPGAGNGYEAEYLFNTGFKNVYILDITETPLNNFKRRNPSFPISQLILGDFFTHTATYDLILEQTFFCSFPPIEKTRNAYVKKMSNLLTAEGKLVGLWFNLPLLDDFEKRPFGGNKALYLSYLKPYFKVKTFEKCYNSIPNRDEFFGIFIKL